MVAVVVSRFFLGNYPAFEVPAYEIASPFEVFPYMAVGVAAGLVAVAFIRTLDASEDLFAKIPIPEYLKAILGGLLVGTIALQLPPNVSLAAVRTLAGIDDATAAASVKDLPSALAVAAPVDRAPAATTLVG